MSFLLLRVKKLSGGLEVVFFGVHRVFFTFQYKNFEFRVLEIETLSRVKFFLLNSIELDRELFEITMSCFILSFLIFLG